MSDLRAPAAIALAGILHVAHSGSWWIIRRSVPHNLASGPMSDRRKWQRQRYLQPVKDIDWLVFARMVRGTR